MQNEVMEVEGQRWLVKQARSQADAMDAINMARVSGSVGSESRENDETIAHVVQINSDGTERKPYEAAY